MVRILALAFVTFFCLTARSFGNSANQWAVIVTGGGSPDQVQASLYKNAQDYNQALSGFGIDGTHSFQHFGNKNGLRCLAQTPADTQIHFQGHNYSSSDLQKDFATAGPGHCLQPETDAVINNFISNDKNTLTCNRALTPEEKKEYDEVKGSEDIDPRIDQLDNLGQNLNEAKNPIEKAQRVLNGMGSQLQKRKPTFILPASKKDVLASLNALQKKFSKAGPEDHAGEHILVVLSDHGLRKENMSGSSKRRDLHTQLGEKLLHEKLQYSGFLKTPPNESPGSNKIRAIERREAAASSEGDSWIVALGDGKDISDRELKPILEDLEKKGAIVHLSVDACFSGGFNRLTSLGKTGSICTTSTANEKSVSYGNGGDGSETEFSGALKKFGNQLQAEACFLSGSEFNRPGTSLDLVVQKWQKHLPPKVVAGECVPGRSFAELEKTANQMIATLQLNDSDYGVRKELLKNYKDIFLGAVKACASPVDDITGKIFKWVSACYPQSSFAKANSGVKILPAQPPLPEISDLDKVDITEAGGRVSAAYALNQIKQHLEFLRRAPIENLREFKSTFCCLGYNFQTKKAPSLCR